MAFRRDAQQGVWARWCREWRDLIIAARVPDFIIESQQAWYSFLDHGYYEECGPSRHFDYSVESLSRDEQEKLLQLIETDPDVAETTVARRLRQLLANEEK